MPALEAEAVAPEISLPSTDGRTVSLNHLRTQAPVVLAFFKVGCPTCQYAFPFLERISRAYAKDKLAVIGVSQDSRENTLEFMKKFGVTFPVLLDDTQKYPASNAYRLTNVPSIFLVSPNGRIELSTVGWVKDEIVKLNRTAAKLAAVAPAEIFKKNESLVDFKAG
jgi:peroxiredoxin